MTFTEDGPDGRSQDLTCAEADGKIVIDKMLVNKLTELLITSIYSVHTSRRAIIWCLSWLLDFSLSFVLKISVSDLQAYLIAAGAMFLVGLGVFLCT
jgi:hypothetical protein